MLPSSEQTHQSLLDTQTQVQETQANNSNYYTEPESEDPPSDTDDVFFADIESTGPLCQITNMTNDMMNWFHWKRRRELSWQTVRQ